MWVNLGESFKNKKMILYAGQQWRLRHRKEICGHSRREGGTKRVKWKHTAVVQPLSHVQLFDNPWITAYLASLSFMISKTLVKLMSIESVMPSNHLILCHPLHFPPSIFPSIWVFSNKSVLCYQVAKVLQFQPQHQSFQ